MDQLCSAPRQRRPRIPGGGAIAFRCGLPELNDLNRGAVHCRFLQVDDTVHVAAEHLLDTLDDEEITFACQQLDHQVRTVGPLLAVHRG